MGLRNLLLKGSSALLALTLLLGMSRLHAQSRVINTDSVFTRLFDAGLRLKKISEARLCSTPTVIISNLNCVACVGYFTKARKHFNIVFILGNESLAEVSRTLAYYHLDNRKIYFTTCKYIRQFRPTLCENPTPCLIYRHQGQFSFLNYHELSQLTDEFSASVSLLKRRLGRG